MNTMPRMYRSAPVSPEDTPEWFSKALCAEADPELFFPTEKNGIAVATQAKAVCAKCVVRSDCLLYALTNNEQHGIWGGLAPKERKAMQNGTYRPKPQRSRFDEAAVVLAVAGEGQHLGRRDLREAIRRLHALKYSDGLIAETLHCNPRTVWKARHDLGLAAIPSKDRVNAGGVV